MTDEKILFDKFKQQLNFSSDEIFIKDETRSLSFVEFKSFALSITSELQKLNLSAGDLVLIDIKDPFYFTAYVFACLHLKLKPALLNSYFKPEQVNQVLMDNIYSGFIMDQIHKGIRSTKIDPTETFQFEDGQFEVDPRSEIIFFTSGSIKSKACVLTLENFFYSALGSLENIPFHKKDIWGLCLPLFHVGGFSILIRAILSNGSIYASDKINDEITHVSLVSTQFMRYLANFESLGNLKHILLGGSAIPESALVKAVELKLPIYKSYGMTEMASQICTTKKLNSIEQISSSGFLLNYRELKIIDKQIYVKGPCLFKGYLKNNELEPNNEWFFTKDYGVIQDGQIQILGRSDRIFQSAGENISPELIEQELLKVPGISKAFVTPETDSTYGLRPVAYIERDKDLSDETIYSEIEKKLSGLYRPKSLKPWNESPKISWKQ